MLLLHERDPERNPLDIFDEVAERTGLSFDRVKYLPRARRSPRPLPLIHDFAGRPRLVCIEAHPRVRQEILDYFAAQNYRVVAKYLRLDVNNLWFVPAA